MKKILLFLIMLFTVTGFAQEVAEGADALDASFNALTQFFLPAVLGAALTLFADASKHLKAGTWDTMIFIKTKGIPFLMTLIVGVGIYYMLIYASFLKPFLEILAGTGLSEITAAAFLGFGAALIDGFMKSPEESESTD